MLETDVRFLKGVGPARSRQLAKLDIHTVGDLLLHVPTQYRDRRIVTPIRNLIPGEESNVSGTVVSSGLWKSRKGKSVFQVELEDSSGRIKLSFFNWKYIAGRLQPGSEVIASGKVDFFGGLSIVHPDLIFLNGESAKSPLVLPVYPLTAGITQGIMRKLITSVIEKYVTHLSEILPSEVLNSYGFQNRAEVVRAVHFPEDPLQGEQARKVLALEELFLFQSILNRVRMNASHRPGILIVPPPDALRAFLGKLPYELTNAQKKAVRKITEELSRDVPMRRLLQGDVGSGKTVIAAAACALCCGAGYQVAVVAPTEVLAAQHNETLKGMLEPMGIRCDLLTGGTTGSQRKSISGSLKDGSLGVLIGTHAVLEDTVVIPELGLCIIDEQHKFGVEQREKLLAGRQPCPHLLIMSATPIPRTLAMTVYGDLDITLIDEMPPGRGRIHTRVMSRDERSEVYSSLLKRLELGERAYVVYPLREASLELDLKDATTSFQVLRDGPLGKYNIGLLTGAMKPSDKLDVTRRFASGEISVLVSTTVIEVGLDVPEATVMIVVNAERFGLSQLHQLRGRIGRGEKDSWCFLMKGYQCGIEPAQRLSVLASTDNGFTIAEKDLELRGPGDIIGTKQHGIPVFRIASLITDADLIEKASELASCYSSGKHSLQEYRWRFGHLDLPGI